MSRYEIRIQEPDGHIEYHWICVQWKWARKYANDLFDKLNIEYPKSKYFTNMAHYPWSKWFKTSVRDCFLNKLQVINLDIPE